MNSPARRRGARGAPRFAPDQITLGQARSLQRLFRHHRQPDVRLALDVGRDVAADVRARGRAKTPEVAAVVFETRRGPPEAYDVRVVGELLARVQVFGFEEGLRAL